MSLKTAKSKHHNKTGDRVMKKIIAVICIITILATALVGCAKQKDSLGGVVILGDSFSTF